MVTQRLIKNYNFSQLSFLKVQCEQSSCSQHDSLQYICLDKIGFCARWPTLGPVCLWTVLNIIAEFMFLKKILSSSYGQ